MNNLDATFLTLLFIVEQFSCIYPILRRDENPRAGELRHQVATPGKHFRAARQSVSAHLRGASSWDLSSGDVKGPVRRGSRALRSPLRAMRNAIAVEDDFSARQ